MELSHYKFRIKLQQIVVKWNNKIILVNEYKTSKTCCECGNEKNDLGCNKTYKCSECLLIIDRDINVGKWSQKFIRCYSARRGVFC